MIKDKAKEDRVDQLRKFGYQQEVDYTSAGMLKDANSAPLGSSMMVSS